MIERVLIGWQATATVQDFLDAEHLGKIGKEFIIRDVILGGMILSPTGDALTSFGRPPTLSWEDVRLRGETYRHDPEEKTIDVSLAPTDTGLVHQIILCIPGPGHALSKQGAAVLLADTLVNDAIVAAFAAALFGLLFLAFVLRPHAQLQKAA
ncbi:MAG: hypothetical protein V7703_15930, partial [Hyphomicrobiales bacterium]